MELISVMIVDDDKILLDEIIQCYDWEKYGFKVVATALNGLQAFNKFKEHNPDMIITDISMPVMNGIDLLKEIRLHNQDTYILLLSSYDDFNYAKQGIKYHANDYILKNDFIKEDFTKKLNCIRTEFLNKYNNSQFYTEKLLKDFFISPHTYNIPDSIMNQYVFKKQHSFILLQEDIPVFQNDEAKESFNENQQINILKSHGYSNFKIEHMFKLSINTQLLVVAHSTVNSKATYCNKLADFCQHILSEMNSSNKGKVSVIYASSPMTVDEFKATYNNLSVAIRQFSYTYNHRIIDLLNVCNKNHIKLFSEKFEAILNSLKTGNFDEAIYLLCELNTAIVSLNGFKLPTYLLENIIETLDNIYFAHMFYHISISTMYSYQEFLLWCIKNLREICSKTNGSTTKEISAAVKYVINYVNQNYSDSTLNIPLLANKTYLSCGYLSSIFKNEVNKSINEYITDIRMEKAVQLLFDRSYKVYEIASLVGYSSGQYFSQTFNKYYGVSPKEYRRSLL